MGNIGFRGTILILWPECEIFKKQPNESILTQTVLIFEVIYGTFSFIQKIRENNRQNQY